MWFQKIRNDAHIEYKKPTKLQQDNKSTITCRIIQMGNLARTKHIDVRYHYVLEKHASADIYVDYTKTQHMIADLFTKALGRIAFTRLRDLIMS